jgi:1,4-dihydroxy-2-naphthoyl-CoA synthase
MNHNPFQASAWRPVDGFADLTDITYHRHITDATVRVAFNRPEVRSAFRRTRSTSCTRRWIMPGYRPMSGWCY